MVEPTSGQIPSTAAKPGNSRPKVESERKSATTEASTAAGAVSSDRIELTLGSTEQTEHRPDQEPIDSDELAGEIVQFARQHISADPTTATFAQANLNPERVLELIA